MNINDKYKEMNSIFDVPEIAYPYLYYFISEEEERIIIEAKNDVLSEKKVIDIIKKNVDYISDFEIDSYLYRLYSRAIIDKVVINNELNWEISNFWQRMTYLAQFEKFRWEMIPEKVRESLDKMYIKKYGEERRRKYEKMQRGELNTIEDAYFLTLEESLQILEKNDSTYIIPCNCKALKLTCKDEKPIDCCMAFSKGGINSIWDRGHGTELSLEESKDMIKLYRKKGLMQVFEIGWGFCNCCGDCCYPIRSADNYGLKGLWPLKRYEIIWNKKKCVSCGKCIKVCNFDAFSKKSGEVIFDKEKCLGCTICYEVCPIKAIDLNKIVNDSDIGLEIK